MKTLFLVALAAGGLGFAGYVYLVPYARIERAAAARQAEAANARGAAEALEAERDKLKADLEKVVASDQEKSNAATERQAHAGALATALRPGLEQLGATVTVEGVVLSVSFPAAKVIAANGIDLSTAGMAALKILAATAKKQDANVRIRARASAAQPPKPLRRSFHSTGELRAARAARVMTALEDAGMGPTHVQIVGQPEKPPARTTRSRKPPPPPADHLEFELEPA
jgi:hypothetical protein